MTVTVSDSGILFADGSLQPTALTTGTQTIAGAKTFSSNVTLGAGVQGALVLGTAQNTTSGTAIDFTGIPSWARRVTVMFDGVSTSGTSNWLVRLGTSGGIVSTGYLGAASYAGGANVAAGANSTTGFIFNVGGGGQAMHGSMTITLLNASTNRWVEQGVLGDSTQTFCFFSGGNVALGGTLDRLRLTTVNGTDTFDAGSVNIMYEG